jgi:exopolysaccharide production protein ExoZ
VDLFFVISGFVMVYSHFEDFGVPGTTLSFARRRVIRIAPLYWLATTITVLLLVAVPHLFSSITFDWQNVLCSYLFVLSPNSLGDVGTVTQTGWTLCYEAYFYLVFALLLTLPRRLFLPAAAVVFGTGVVVGASGVPIPPWATVAVNPLVLEFLLGAALAFVFLRGAALPAWLAIAVMIVGAGGIILMAGAENWSRVVTWGTAAGLILVGALSLERFDVKVPKLLVALGASSYALYLVHPLFLGAFGKAWALLHLSNVLPIVPGAIAFVVVLAIGHAVYVLIERPMTVRLKALRPE